MTRAPLELMAPLPQFDGPRSDVADPDRTLERLPRLSAAAVRRVLPAPVPPPVRPAPDFDMAVTVEIVPEIGADDILEAEPVAPAAPLVLPPRAEFVPEPAPASAAPFELVPQPAPPSAVPFDLSRLLLQAQSEARRSPEYFHAEPFPPRVAPSSPLPIVTVDRTDSLAALTVPLRGVKHHLAWIAATVVAVALATFGIALAQPHSSASNAGEAARAATERQPLISRDALSTVSRAPITPSTAWHSAGSSTFDGPSVAVQSLPQVEVGTVSLAAVAATHRLFVDGHLAPGGSTVVSCGSHVVRVGARGASHRIQVACGQEVIVAN